MIEYVDSIVIAACVGSGVVAGIFFAFSTFIMRALQQIPDEHGIGAMQRINVTVLNPLFFIAFFGTAILCLVLAWYAITGGIESERALVLLAGALYVIGCLLVTIVFNVPLNNRLAALKPAETDSEAFWTFYNSRWVFWNHVRTAASLLAAVLFAIALTSN